jgi:arabinogalactan endo-1,4-beta-galactosidase
MQNRIKSLISALFTLTFIFGSCTKTESEPIDGDPGNELQVEDFYFGADLSYVNQILDFGGVFKDGGEAGDPYRILKDHGTNLARFRLWHNPQWTKDVYGAEGRQLYNDLLDVEKSITAAKTQGLEVLLDFHYSDVWADPGNQKIPVAWEEITSIEVLEDSVYNYTFKTLKYLADKGLMPEFVQVGNETNCGMMYSEAPANFPKLNVCDDQWQNLGKVVNGAISAIRDVDAQVAVETKVILHVADPVNVQWWFDNIVTKGSVTDFEIIGFSYYPVWHNGISIKNLGAAVSNFKNRYSRDIMILETAYPWTPDGNDNYKNIFGASQALGGYPLTVQGQKSMMHDITQQMITGGGIGIIYWEPAWITSEMKDLWGTGSSWENCTFFDFNGNLHEGIDFINDEYE